MSGIPQAQGKRRSSNKLLHRYHSRIRRRLCNEAGLLKFQLLLSEALAAARLKNSGLLAEGLSATCGQDCRAPATKSYNPVAAVVRQSLVFVAVKLVAKCVGGLDIKRKRNWKSRCRDFEKFHPVEDQHAADLQREGNGAEALARQKVRMMELTPNARGSNSFAAKVKAAEAQRLNPDRFSKELHAGAIIAGDVSVRGVLEPC